MSRVGLVAWLIVGGCVGPWDPDWELNGTDDSDVPTMVRVSGQIDTDTRWTSETTWVLTEPIFVVDGAKLTIEAGTTVLGEQGSALVISRDASLNAQGRPAAPIVFTSEAPVGERVAGDWGGLVLLGEAPVSDASPTLPGLADAGALAGFGGKDESHNCGVLSYVRIEFAGLTESRASGLDGLTLAGCGSQTLVNRVQVHRAAHDGVNVLGGSVGLQNVVVTAAGEDGLDWNAGWIGQAQFLIVQQQLDYLPQRVASGINGGGLSRPFLSNVTLIGPGSSEGTQVGITLSSGTAGQFINVLTVGMGGEIMDIADAETANVADEERLGVRAVVAHDIGVDGRTPFREEAAEDDDDEGFDEAAWFEASAESNRLVLSSIASRDARSATAPDFVPLATVWVDAGAAERPPEGSFWDEGARYVGAVEPGSSPSQAWYAGWTDFPLN